MHAGDVFAGHYTVISISCDIIIESVDFISRDGPDTPIYVIHYKITDNSLQVWFYTF